MIRITNFGDIAQGWYNVIRQELGVLPEMLRKKSEERLLICSTCSDRKNNNCGLCGCMLVQKSMSNSNCPANKWK